MTDMTARSCLHASVIDLGAGWTRPIAVGAASCLIDEMSRTKAFLFDKLPQDEVIRAAMAREWSSRAKEFVVRIPTRRANPQGRPRWDPLWPSCLHKAAQELRIETMQINDGLHLRNIAERDMVLERAEVMLAQRREALFGARS